MRSSCHRSLRGSRVWPPLPFPRKLGSILSDKSFLDLLFPMVCSQSRLQADPAPVEHAVLRRLLVALGRTSVARIPSSPRRVLGLFFLHATKSTLSPNSPIPTQRLGLHTATLAGCYPCT